MSKSNLLNDMKFVVNGIQKVLSTQIAIEKSSLETIMHNSSIHGTSQQLNELRTKLVPKDLKDIAERASMVPRGFQAYMQHAVVPLAVKNSKFLEKSIKNKIPPLEEEILVIHEDDLDGIYMKSLGVELLHDDQAKETEAKLEVVPPCDKNIETKLDHKQQACQPPIAPMNVHDTVNRSKSKQHLHTDEVDAIHPRIKPLSKGRPESRLGTTSKERKVPASRIGRLVSYGSLAAGLGIGALAEVTKRSIGLQKIVAGNSSPIDSNPFLSDANAQRIVDTLCTVRGAALKVGQILSIQDDTFINPKLQSIFERVRHGADFMPNWQMEQMMEAELGTTWRERFSEFEMKPFAAASIGEVHLGKLHDGRSVAVKVQYPGVAQGIESDIDNLMSILGVWNIVPKGMFLDNVVEVAKHELRWEVDYRREMKCAKKFRALLQPYHDYYVPEVIEDLTTSLVYTTELIDGIPVDKCHDLDQESRNRICYLLLDLFFRELFEFRFMQTDPNWSNFLYNLETKQIGLLDFGASRGYKKEFVDKYLKILKGAATKDRKLILDVSKDIGFLTGYESKVMENSHVETVILLGEAFRTTDDNPYDFGTQKITLRIQELVPIMVKERLCPPPEEIYSLHRKLSGVFLLCSRLKGRVNCKPIFERIWNNYDFSPENPSDADHSQTVI